MILELPRPDWLKPNVIVWNDLDKYHAVFTGFDVDEACFDGIVFKENKFGKLITVPTGRQIKSGQLDSFEYSIFNLPENRIAP